MKIVFSKLPRSGWWSKGIPKYKDNPAMVEGAIPNIDLLNKERKNLITSVVNTGHEVIELDFPIELDRGDPKHDFIFIRDPFISNQNGLVVILRAGIPQRRIENKVIKKCLEPLGLKMMDMPDKSGMRADGGEFYFCKKNNVYHRGEIIDLDITEYAFGGKGIAKIATEKGTLTVSRGIKMTEPG